jgi:hypothetical protein
MERDRTCSSRFTFSPPSLFLGGGEKEGGRGGDFCTRAGFQTRQGKGNLSDKPTAINDFNAVELAPNLSYIEECETSGDEEVDGRDGICAEDGRRTGEMHELHVAMARGASRRFVMQSVGSRDSVGKCKGAGGASSDLNVVQERGEDEIRFSPPRSVEDVVSWLAKLNFPKRDLHRYQVTLLLLVACVFLDL